MTCARKALRIAAALGGLLASLGPAAAAAQATPAPSFSISPLGRQPYFVLHARPGERIHASVRVTNDGKSTATVRLYAVDGTTGQTSGAVYLPVGARRRDVGAWTSLGASALTLAPHAHRIVPFTVTVPASAGPGQHLGGLVAAPLAPLATRASQRGGRTFRVQVREISIVAVLVDLPGGLAPRMQITGVSASGRPGYQTLLIGLANVGDGLTRGSGSITVLAASGSRVLRRAFPLDTFVPHTSIQYPVYVSGHRLPAGRYRARVVVRYGSHGHVARTVYFSISNRQLRTTYGTLAPAGLRGGGGGGGMPTWELALAALLIAAVGAGAGTLARRSGARR